MKKMFNEVNRIHNFMSSSGSGTVINYGSRSDFLTSYGSGSTSQKVTVPKVPVPVPVPQHCLPEVEPETTFRIRPKNKFNKKKIHFQISNIFYVSYFISNSGAAKLVKLF